MFVCFKTNNNNIVIKECIKKYMDKPGYNQAHPHNANQIIIMNIKVYKILQKK